MLAARIIYPIDKSKWTSPRMVYPKKQDPQISTICVKFRGLNKVIITYPFPTPFVDEIIN
jgi:hypothetical protein